MAERDARDAEHDHPEVMGNEPEVVVDEDPDKQGPNIESVPPSEGSAGHDWGLCRRPCIYHLAGNCNKGGACSLAKSGSCCLFTEC